MQTVADLLAATPAFAEVSEEHCAIVGGCGRNEIADSGRYLMREGEDASLFYVIRTGTVALETFVPHRGPVTIQTLHDGDLVGWSWLFAPHKVSFDARVVDTTRLLTFDGACLRGKCEAQPDLGYALFKVFARVMAARLQATRIQLLDVYATGQYVES